MIVSPQKYILTRLAILIKGKAVKDAKELPERILSLEEGNNTFQ
jgi:hypothetical protein